MKETVSRLFNYITETFDKITDLKTSVVNEIVTAVSELTGTGHYILFKDICAICFCWQDNECEIDAAAVHNGTLYLHEIELGWMSLNEYDYSFSDLSDFIGYCFNADNFIVKKCSDADGFFDDEQQEDVLCDNNKTEYVVTVINNTTGSCLPVCITPSLDDAKKYVGEWITDFLKGVNTTKFRVFPETDYITVIHKETSVSEWEQIKTLTISKVNRI